MLEKISAIENASGGVLSQQVQDSAAGNTSPDSIDVPLDVPIFRGKTKIESISVRRPNSGALRGLSLMNVANMDVSTLQKLLPRITTPALTEAEIATALDVADLTSLGLEVAGFLAKKKDLQAFQ